MSSASTEETSSFYAKKPVEPINGIDWAEKTIKKKVSLEDRELDVSFEGICVVDSLKELSVEHTCGCLETSVNSKMLQKGDRCLVHARLDLTPVSGSTIKTVKLKSTDVDGKVSTTSLRIDVTMPSAVAVEPQALYWDKDGELISKTATIRPLIEGVVLSTSLDSPYWTCEFDPASGIATMAPLKRPNSVAESEASRCRYALCRIAVKLPSGTTKQYVLWGVQRE